MAIYQLILDDLKKSMLARDEVRTRVLRSLKAALLEKEVSIRTGGAATLSEDQVMDVLVKATKQRRDSLEQFENAGREDLASIEREELAIIETYLPKKLTQEEIEAEVAQAIAQIGASSPADMGKVMGLLTPKLKGKADGAVISAIVKRSLTP